MIISQISQALQNEIPFTVMRSEQGEWHFRELTLLQRMLHAEDKNYHIDRLNRIAKALFESLEKIPKLPINQVLNHPVLSTARRFLRQVNFTHPQPKYVNACSRMLLALKLELTIEDLNKNEGFESFAFKSHLERYLMEYGHDVTIDEAGTLWILCEGKYEPWSEVRTKLEGWEEPKKNFPNNPRQMWYYGQNGVQKKDMYAWETLEPYQVLSNHDWGDRYLFEFCACCGDSVQLNGDHSWLELKTPKGEVYSVGLYRPGKMNKMETYHFPMRVKKGYLMSPDVSIWWPTEIYRIPVEISEAEFKAIKQSIEEDKKDEEALCFQLFNGNCQEYVNKKAALAGIKLPTEKNLLRQLVPIKLQEAADWTLSKLSLTIRKIVGAIGAFFINVIQWALGAMMVDKSLKGLNVKTHLSSFEDFFDVSKLFYHPPRHLALEVKKVIDQYRESTNLPYALPPEFIPK